jgi:hypothetical protein
MATDRRQIARWFQEGVHQKATHLIVVCDTFDWVDYPVFVKQGEDPHKKALEFGSVNEQGLPTLPNDNMQQVMEVYSLKQDMASQIAETRAFHFD